MKGNPRYAYFCSMLKDADADWSASWAGDCWRYQDIEFPSGEEVLSGEGAFQNGGRLNAIRSFHVVYGSAAEKTALGESAAGARRYGLKVRKPRILICIEMKLQKVLDLTQAALRKTLGVTLAELGAEDWESLQNNGIESVGQAIGRAAFHSKAEAVIIPSFADKGGINIGWFPKNALAGSVVRIVEGEKLPSVKRKKGSK